MKTMTCKQLGGPCELGHSGDSADEIIKAQDKPLRAAVKAGDESHQEARQEMKFRWLHPKRSMGWYHDTKAAFARPSRELKRPALPRRPRERPHADQCMDMAPMYHSVTDTIDRAPCRERLCNNE